MTWSGVVWHAGELVKICSRAAGCSGGGRPTLAQAAVRKRPFWIQALASVASWVEEKASVTLPKIHFDNRSVNHLHYCFFSSLSFGLLVSRLGFYWMIGLVSGFIISSVLLALQKPIQ